MPLFRNLETDRLQLRTISPDDRDFILMQFSTDDVNRYLFDAEPMTDISEADELIEFYNQPEPRMQQRWILILKETDEKIGTCGFHCWDRDAGRAEIGYDMQKPYWGKGYMSEAVRTILDFAKTDMKLKQLDAHISLDNDKSANCAARNGFSDTGERYMEVFRGKEYPHAVYSRNF